MKSYEEQYYILSRTYKDDCVYVYGTPDSEDREYEDQENDYALGPLTFNIWDEDIKLKGRAWKDVLSHVHMDNGSKGFLISQAIYDEIKFLEIDHVSFFPAVIITPNQQFVEGYYYCQTPQYMHFVDFNQSEADDEFYDENDPDSSYLVDKFVLNKEKLDQIEEERRLIFHPAHVDCSRVMVHQKIMDLMLKYTPKGGNIDFFRVDTYTPLEEYRFSEQTDGEELL